MENSIWATILHLQVNRKQEQKTMADLSSLPADYYLLLLQKMERSEASIKEQEHCYGKQNCRMQDSPHRQLMKSTENNLL